MNQYDEPNDELPDPQNRKPAYFSRRQYVYDEHGNSLPDLDRTRNLELQLVRRRSVLGVRYYLHDRGKLIENGYVFEDGQPYDEGDGDVEFNGARPREVDACGISSSRLERLARKAIDKALSDEC
jgi:hypothetical protein